VAGYALPSEGAEKQTLEPMIRVVGYINLPCFATTYPLTRYEDFRSSMQGEVPEHPRTYLGTSWLGFCLMLVTFLSFLQWWGIGWGLGWVLQKVKIFHELSRL
jgi:hypothetical protein